MARTSALVAVAALAIVAAPAPAQYLTRPQIPWRTITTPRFDIHFPAEMEEWTLVVARQMETVADQVNLLVGSAPAARVTVIVEDPSTVANGFALPFLEGPVIFLWPTPPPPSATFGAHRGWGEILAIHEYAHIAHLTIASRNPGERRLWQFVPARIGPVTRKSPAWVIEGYATLVEGQLTGSGRPLSAGRAAVLRQWALEGRLPTYAQLNGTSAYLGGNMRYLMGSAFLEWLQRRRGDSSLVHLWRRMSARQDRSFDEAFTGVFGAPASDLYGHFTVELTEHSLQIRSRLRAAGLAGGELVQRLSGGTGEPAVSPDGERVALVLRPTGGRPRLVVWSTRPEPDSLLRRQRERMLQRDSLDVAPFDSFPRPRRALATLHPVQGRSHEQPRWMPDGVRILVTRDEPAPYGVTRPDVFEWNTRSGALRRITSGAGIRQADPSPDGRAAAGVRCHGGICSLVLVDLASGRWRDLVRGTPGLVWHRPRFSPDGRRIAASVHENGQWRLAIVDAATGGVTRLATDDGESRYAPTFLPDGRNVVVVSERGGVPNLELVPLGGGSPRALTRVTGAVAAPDVNRADGSVWFLSLRSGGSDLHRLPAPDESNLGPVVAIRGPAVPAGPPEFPRIAQPDGGDAAVIVTDYGLGPRRWRVLPGGAAGPDGHTTTLVAANIDPVGRLNVLSQAAFGSRGTWRGGSIAAGFRGLPVALDVAGWRVEHEPSRSRDHLSGISTDIRFTGAGVQASLFRDGSSLAWRLRTVASAGRVVNHGTDADRAAVLGEVRMRVSRTFGPLNTSGTAGLALETGRSAGDPWQRSSGMLGVVAGTARLQIRGEWLQSAVTAATPESPGRAVEQFVVGGASNPLIDPAFLSQRITLPGVPAGFVTGRTVDLVRASLSGGSWEPYFIWVGTSFDSLRRVAGVERSFGISSLGFARLPGIRARAGASYSFDQPFAGRPRAYASLTFTP